VVPAGADALGLAIHETWADLLSLACKAPLHSVWCAANVRCRWCVPNAQIARKNHFSICH